MKLIKIFSKNKKLINFSIRKIYIILLVALIFRVFLGFFGTLSLDQNTFIAWSLNLSKNGFAGFYNSWCDYLPGYLYVLWFLGKINALFSFIPTALLYKIPAIFADLFTGYLIYEIVKKLKNENSAIWTSVLYVFNPAVLANSTLWGQVDSLTALFSIFSVYILNKSFILSAVFLALGVLIKPQAALTVFVILFIFFREKWNIKKLLVYGIVGLLTFLIPFIPFALGNNFFPFVFERLMATLSQYPYTSVNAFSVWGLSGFWKPDSGTILPSVVGGASLLTLSFLVSYKLFKLGKNVKGAEYILLGILFLAGFMFMTRMHERHLLPAFAPLIISASLITDLYIPYISLSFTYIANLYYSYIWITDKFKEIFSGDVIKLLIILNISSLLILIKRILSKDIFSEGKLIKVYNLFFTFFRKNEGVLKEISVSLPQIKIEKKVARVLFLVILLFAFFSRLYKLNTPSEEYFDEVYHAFTAKLVLHSDPKAWEWWNPHPEGFAYEWTHPPLAKLGMALGMVIFGENSFGWRIPGALLGTGCVILIYFMAKYLFEDEPLALIAAFVYSLDGLILTMSRIGMNDTYLLFFTLLSIYLFWKEKNFFSALSFGLAISSKWSAIYSIPIFFASYLLLRKKFKRGMLWFLVLPPLIYVGSYFQMFLTGHAFNIFTGVQKQMWWYHTNLKATHPYTSSWWTWPFLIRPVYLYTSEEIGGWVARIYNIGNPVVFWFGFIAIVETAFYAILERNRKLLLLVFSYLIFFVPWALSPRIMFFYHYLPSVPFLVFAMGYTLRRNKVLMIPILCLGLISFLYFYPHWAGLQIPLWWDKSYYWFTSWR